MPLRAGRTSDLPARARTRFRTCCPPGHQVLFYEVLDQDARLVYDDGDQSPGARPFETMRGAPQTHASAKPLP